MEPDTIKLIGELALNGGLSGVLGMAFYFIVRIYRDLTELNKKHRDEIIELLKEQHLSTERLADLGQIIKDFVAARNRR